MRCFRLTSDNVLRHNGPLGGSGEISLEGDLGVDVLGGRGVEGRPLGAGRSRPLDSPLEEIGARPRANVALHFAEPFGGYSIVPRSDAISSSGKLGR